MIATTDSARHLVAAAALGLVLVVHAGVAAAQQQCSQGQGEACDSSEDCAGNLAATLCIEGPDGPTCQVPCDDGFGRPLERECAIGESCVVGVGTDFIAGERYYCAPSRFTMDLNLLDSCVLHFVEGIAPNLTDTNECSLVSRLNQMLDQDANGNFNILDVDLCVRAFLAEQPCDVATETCADGQVYCDDDDECGAGLHCDTALHQCTRECGFIADRLGANLVETLDRQCSGYLKRCDYDSGRCVASDIANTTCEVSRDCPSGAYCFLGECKPKCFRSLDCPGADWFCSTENECLPVPNTSDDPDERPFNPQEYSLMFASPNVALDTLNRDFDMRVLIMDTITKQQVFSRPTVGFGYRVEVSYEWKQSDECRRDLEALTVEEASEVVASCRLRDDQQFLTVRNPFGTMFAVGTPSVDVSLNSGAVENLTPGWYKANVTTIFSNGSTTTASVMFRKPSPNGTYAGYVKSYAKGPENLFGESGLKMELRVDEDPANRIQWDDLLAANNIVDDKPYTDETVGFPITGYIEANDSMFFNNPAARTSGANRVPVKGIYADQLGIIHLVAVSDMPASFCVSEKGSCDPRDDTDLEMRNPFGRAVRRTMHFIGPFDDQTYRFEGIYRDTVTGLGPEAITLDGEFATKQTKQVDTPLDSALDDPILASPLLVNFPSDATVRAINTARFQECPAAVRALFGESAFTYASYIGTDFDAQNQILRNTTVFEERVEDALAQLSDTGGRHVTLREFFRDQISFCDEEPGPACVDREELICGLAAYREAILQGWVPPQDRNIDRPLVGTALFCDVRPGDPQSLDCADTSGADEPWLATLQEANHFYKELVQTHVFQALNGLGDASYVLYTAYNGTAFDTGTAYQYKESALRRAVDEYQRASALAYDAVGTRVLFSWPMGEFAGQGQTLLDQLYALNTDRVDALIQLVDLRRRILRSRGQQDALFAQHVMNLEYLKQVFLLAVQREWQGSETRFAGESDVVFRKGIDLIQKTDEGRNPLGLHPNRVYFENANPAVSNWQNFRDRIQARLEPLKRDTERAIDDMRGALQSQDTFEQSLLLDGQDLEASLDDLCGSPTPPNLPDQCADLDNQQRVEALYCSGPDCLAKYHCNSDACETVSATFEQEVSSTPVLACQVSYDSETFSVSVNGQQRPCHGGRMGALLQERLTLEQQRSQINKRVVSLMRRIDAEARFIEETQSQNQDLVDFIRVQGAAIDLIQLEMTIEQFIYEGEQRALDHASCITIVGTGAVGDSCIASAIATTTSVGLSAAHTAAQAAFTEMQTLLQREKEIYLQEDGQRRELRQLRMNLDNLVTEVEGLVAEYEATYVQLLNLQTQILDTQYLAEQAAKRHSEKLEFLIDHLLGRESGSLLVRNKLMQKVDTEFQKVLLDTYKMTQAFIHRFNLDDRAESWRNQVYQIMTIQDVEDYLAFLTEEEQNYCGAQGVDCDYINNRQIFEFSVQKQLFPDLRDIMDPVTGRVLTVGQQFHNIITSSAYVKRRARQFGVTDQIELPFAIWLNDRGTNGAAPQRYMVGPGDCNHIIASNGNSGTIAVNAIGTRIPRSPGVTYELWRGATDYVRSCTDRISSDESEINVYTVGWSPNNRLGQTDSPPSFVSLSGELSACINNNQLGNPATANSQEGCFHYYARDRSLGAPDYRLVLPQVDEAQSWIFGEGLPSNERPVIEDLVVYIRYNDRPISPDQ